MKSSLKLISILLAALLLGFAPAGTFNVNDESTGIQVGETAPEINSVDITGKEVNWEQLLEKGSVVVVFYRGSWCPHCNIYLANLQRKLDQIEDYGTLVAITPQKPERIEQTINTNNLKFHVVYDENAKYIKQYKSVSTKRRVSNSRKAKNRDYDNNVLPVPATYIVNSDGVVTKRHFDENYKRRMDVSDLLDELMRLKREREFKNTRTTTGK